MHHILSYLYQWIDVSMSYFLHFLFIALCLSVGCDSYFCCFKEKLQMFYVSHVSHNFPPEVLQYSCTCSIFLINKAMLFFFFLWSWSWNWIRVMDPCVPLTAVGFFIVTAKYVEGYRSGHISLKHLHVKVKNKSSRKAANFWSWFSFSVMCSRSFALEVIQIFQWKFPGSKVLLNISMTQDRPWW